MSSLIVSSGRSRLWFRLARIEYTSKLTLEGWLMPAYRKSVYIFNDDAHAVPAIVVTGIAEDRDSGLFISTIASTRSAVPIEDHRRRQCG